MENMFLKIEVVSEINEIKVETGVFFRAFVVMHKTKNWERLRGSQRSRGGDDKTKKDEKDDFLIHGGVAHRKKCKAIISLPLAFYTDAQLCWQAPGIVLTCHADNLLWVSHLFELYHFFQIRYSDK